MKILAGVRNAIVHANGHLERVQGKNIRTWIEQDIGIEDYYGEIIVTESFVNDTYYVVKGHLEDLIARFKDWDSSHWNGDTGSLDG